MKVTVIGNGISRIPIPLNKIPGVTVGCNEVYKEMTPNYLCAVDFVLLYELHESNYKGPVCFRFKSLNLQGLKPKRDWFCPNFMDHNSSGHAAIELAAGLDATEIDILGFDCQVGRVYGEHTPPSSFQRWVDTLIHQADKYPIRRIVGENSLDIPEIKNTISVQDYINELERKLHYGDISSGKK